MRNYFMNIKTSWQATTYAYQGSITINYEPPPPNTNGFTGDFDILPSHSITYGDTFKLHPREIETTGTCTFQSVKFRITRGTLVYEGTAIASKTTDDVYTSAKYPFVIQAGAEHEVYMQIQTSCGSDWIGPKTLNIQNNGGGGTPTPAPTSGPTPAPDNKPPVARISWLKSGTTSQVAVVALNSVVDVKLMEKSDPDGDEVTVKDWDFDSSSEWLKSKGESFGGSPYEAINGFAGIAATELGAHTIKMTLQDTKGATYTTSATLNVVDAKPVAVIRAPINVVEGRALPSPIDGTMSYSPLGLQITEYDWTNKADRYYTPENEIVKLRVKDEEGRWSDLAQKTIAVLPDLPPIDTLAVPSEGTRLGTSTIQSGAYSPDYDQIVSHKLEMKYDAANDGFANDSWQTVVNGNGDADSYTFTPSRVGKYLFQESVCEDFGKCGNTDSQAQATRTLNVTNLAPTADVKTESDVTDPPSSTPMLMTDLFNNGRFYNMAKGAVGDKSSWKLENGVLKSKLKTPLRNVGEAHKAITSDYQNGVPYYYQGFSDNGTLSDYGETYGFDNRVATPFFSMQSNPSTTQLYIPGLTGSVMGWIEDDKYTYIMTQPDRYWYNDQTLFVYDKSFNLVWSKAIPYTPIETQRWVYGSYIDTIHFTGQYYTSEQVMRVHNHTLTITVRDKNDPAQEFFIGYNRDTGSESFKIPSETYGRSFIGPDGYLLGTKKYDFNGNDTGITFPFLQADRAFTSFKYNYYYGNSNNNYVMFNPNMTPKADYGNNWANGDRDHTQPYFIGTDSNGNLIGAGSGDPLYGPPYGGQTRIYKLAPNGALTYAQFPNLRLDGDDLKMTLLALDYKDHVWFSGSSYDAHEVKVYDESANLLKVFPFRMPELRPGNPGVICRSQYGFVGADGLVTIMGMCLDTQAPTGQAVYFKYLVIDPTDLSVVVEGNTPNMAMYAYPNRNPGTGFPTFIHPHDDQTFIIEFRDNDRAFYTLKTNGATPRPKIVDAGESTPDLVTGSFVAANQTLKASLKAAAPDGKGTGIAFRIRDDRNYYSLEWEASELRVKNTVNGGTSVVWSKPFPMVANQVYDVRIVPAASSFEVYVNRLYQATINESTWTDGKYGIINRAQQDVSFLGASTEATPAGYGKIEGIALVGQQVSYTMSYSDEESDPKLTAGDSWAYSHNPNALLQPQGTASFNGQTLSAAVTSFPFSGDYTFTYKTKDDPHPQHRYPDNAYDAYRQASNTVTGKIRVHRRPIANFTATWNSNGTVSYADASYDPDRYNPANGSYSTENTGIDYLATRGVLEYRYRYRAAGSSTYMDIKPAKLFGGTYVIELSVRDEYNAWSEWATQTIVAGGSAPLPPNPGFTIAPTTQYRFTAVTIDSTASDPQDGARGNIEHAYYIKNLTSGGPESLQSDVRTSWSKEFGTLGVFQIRQVVINSYGLYAETSHNVSIVNRRPYASVSDPASSTAAAPTMYDTLRPAIKWTYGDGDGDPQTQYQLHFYKSDGSFYRDSGARIGSDRSWTPTADFADNTTYYVHVRAFDGIDWSDWSAPRYFRIVTNKPPTADLAWTPSPVWEGDTIKLLPTLSDPDGDRLDAVYEIESPTGAKRTVSEQRLPPYGGAGPSVTADIPGSWKVRLTVSDGKAPAVTVSRTIPVAPLGVTGQVLHTAAWEDKRQRYNADHPGKERPAHWFWAGELFMLEAATTDTGASATKAASVAVEAGPKLKAALQAVLPSRPAVWKGEIGSAQYGRPLKELPEGDYAFVFTAVYTNGVVKKATVVVRVDDTVDRVVNVHRVQ
ncbi:fibronectin type III domain-containing protein [Cohnella sp. JJ-181]|uniref:fibronectin type III domain-containing protein n=1 Tax=Cohnella rhizoplanae TaxID=2974897 RepID=UPI00232FC432|nr:hypothetical protein [Cohnella sp. JJ-181]